MKPSPTRNHPDTPSLARGPAATANNTERPHSTTSGWIALAGFATFLATLWLVRFLKMQSAGQATLLCMGATALVNLTLDALILKTHRRESTGLDWNRRAPS